MGGDFFLFEGIHLNWLRVIFANTLIFIFLFLEFNLIKKNRIVVGELRKKFNFSFSFDYLLQILIKKKSEVLDLFWLIVCINGVFCFYHSSLKEKGYFVVFIFLLYVLYLVKKFIKINMANNLSSYLGVYDFFDKSLYYSPVLFFLLNFYFFDQKKDLPTYFQSANFLLILLWAVNNTIYQISSSFNVEEESFLEDLKIILGNIVIGLFYFKNEFIPILFTFVVVFLARFFVRVIIRQEIKKYLILFNQSIFFGFFLVLIFEVFSFGKRGF